MGHSRQLRTGTAFEMMYDARIYFQDGQTGLVVHRLSTAA